jgi:hypothetical protein
MEGRKRTSLQYTGAILDHVQCTVRATTQDRMYTDSASPLSSSSHKPLHNPQGRHTHTHTHTQSTLLTYLHSGRHIICSHVAHELLSLACRRHRTGLIIRICSSTNDGCVTCVYNGAESVQFSLEGWTGQDEIRT